MPTTNLYSTIFIFTNVHTPQDCEPCLHMFGYVILFIYVFLFIFYSIFLHCLLHCLTMFDYTEMELALLISLYMRTVTIKAF